MTNSTNGSEEEPLEPEVIVPKRTRRPTGKPLTPREKRFAKALYEGMGPIQAARLHLKWRCERGTAEYGRAKDFAVSPMVRAEKARLAQLEGDQAHAENVIVTADKVDIGNLRQFAYDRLTIMRDDPDVNARSRYMAVQALERLNDPSKDINLIYRWVDIMWRYYTGHCPSCHNDFPLWKVKNSKLDRFREEHGYEEDNNIEDRTQRRLAVIADAEKRRHPHPGQIRALSAMERHIVVTGPARVGKSFTLAMFCLMYLLIPGVEVWILARIYDDAAPEFDYLESFLKTLFHPVSKYMVDINIDKKSGEASISTRWGSVIKIKSGKAQGSITGRELEFAVVAEPAWVDESLYEELRARMSSRLGRIVAFGTPKGAGGFIKRMIKQAGRGKDGKLRAPEDRLISAGCPWGESLLYFTMLPADNPAYVTSELEAAKSELTREEYASEFEGIMMASEGARFPDIQKRHLINVTPEMHSRCVYVLGVDQGPKNMGGCLIGWDGRNLLTSWEFFDNTDLTIKANLIQLNREVPVNIGLMGGNPERWRLTIFDADPPVQGILSEMVEEHRPWKSDETYRPKNIKELTNWREETMEWINNMAKQNRLFFDAKNCDVLHDQIMEALIDPKGSGHQNGKGWIIRDIWRGDHVVDAWLMACYCIFSGQLILPAEGLNPTNAFEAAKAAFDAQRARDEKIELYGTDKSKWELRQRPGIFTGVPGWYNDES